jgi:hypothetical protein
MAGTSLIGYYHTPRVHFKKKITVTGDTVVMIPVTNPFGVTSIQLYINGGASVIVSTNDHTQEDYEANTAGEAAEFVEWSYGSTTTSGKYTLQQPHNYIKFAVICPTGSDFVSVVVRV